MNWSTVVVLLVLVAGAWLAWQSHARPLALGLAAFAVLPAVTLSKQLTWPIAVPVAGVVALVVYHRWARTSATVNRWGARARRKSGVASSVDIARKASVRAMRRQAATVRPSLAEVGWRARQRVPVTELAVLLCRVAGQRVYSSIENVVVVFGGPRKGKSAWLASRIIDAPGAVLATSTRTDLITLTAQLRRVRGPVFVFNPVGLGGEEFASTVTFDPLTGCVDPVAAMERASDMVAATVHHGGGAGDRAFWELQARRVLAALLHAAALGELAMRDVLDWVSRPDAAREQLTSVLRRSPEPGFVEEIGQFLATNDRTRTSITSTIMPALSWLTSPPAVRAATGGHRFHVAELLASKATVYMLGAEEAHSAPLVCALTGYIAREARRLAATQPGGRLDPPLTLALDEAALIAPVPLDRWSADMGGRGVCIIAAFQSRAQLIDRYGEARAATTINNAGPKVLFGGTGDRDDLNYWSTLAGERDEPVISRDLHGRGATRTERRVPVLSPAQISQLPPHKVVVFTSGMPPVIGQADRAWRRPDVRAVLQPSSTRVRARAITLRVTAKVTEWSRWPARATEVVTRRAYRWTAAVIVRACHWIAAIAMRGYRWIDGVAVPWIATRWSAFADGVAGLWARVCRRRTAAPIEPVAAEVIPFPTTEWPATGLTAEPAQLPTGEWPHDNGRDDSGRWN
jgi:type IV secretory pathway TraG/TraD family ATPase VirD4